MRELSDKNFGIAIAYLVPGFVILWGASYLSPTVKSWFGVANSGSEATIGSFLFVLLGSLAAGVFVSAVRWAVVDPLHHATGLRPPTLQFSSLQEKLESFLLIVEANYRFYQFYANAFVAVAIFGGCRLVAFGAVDGYGAWAAGLVTEAVLLAGSRDSLNRYYARAKALLGERPEKYFEEE